MANQTRQLAELLRDAGASVSLVPSNAPYRPACIASLPVVRAAFRLLPYLVSLWRIAGRSDVFHVMANSGWSWHLFAAPAIWIARLRGVPSVVNYRGGEASHFLAGSAAIVRCSLRRGALLAVPSPFLEGVFHRHGMSAKVLPNIVDLARFHPPQVPRSGAHHLVVTRNLEPVYDNETALRAFARVRQVQRDARLTIAGSGPDDARLRHVAAELGLGDAVCFSGRLDGDAMAKLYRDADLSLNPSLVDNMPNSLLEAMASGVPIVTTDVGGIPFMVHDGVTAMLVHAGDDAAMARAALGLLADRQQWQALSQAGLREVRRYTWHNVAPKLADIYRRALARAKPETI